MSWKSRYPLLLDSSANDLSVSLVDKDKLSAVEELKKQQSAELTIAQNENKALKQRTADLENDRAGLQALLRDNVNQKHSREATTTNDDIKDLLTGLKAALPAHSAQTANEDLEKTVEVFGSNVREMNALISAREEVQRQSTKSIQPPSASTTIHPPPSTTVSELSSSTTTPQPLSSTHTPRSSVSTGPQQLSIQHHPQPASPNKRQSFQFRLSGIFNSRKANSTQPNIDNQGAGYPASRSPAPAATPPIPPPPTRAPYHRRDGSTQRRSGQY